MLVEVNTNRGRAKIKHMPHLDRTQTGNEHAFIYGMQRDEAQHRWPEEAVTARCKEVRRQAKHAKLRAYKLSRN